MVKKPLTFGEKLERKVDEVNRRTTKNFQMYAEACRKQGVQVGQPIDIMSLLKGKK